jgi:hypothetical protein
MANSTASIVIKPTAAFKHDNTFIFGSWVCTVDGAGSFQRYLTMTPDPEIRLVTLPEVVTGPLVKKFGEFSLCNQVADFGIGTDSNSNLTSPWIKSCESAPKLSCGIVLLHEHFLYGLCNSNRAHAEALAALQAGKEIVSEYSSDSNVVPGYNLDSSYEFYFGSDPIEFESELHTTEEPLSGPAAGFVITSTPAGRFVYWPDRKPAYLTDDNSCCVAYLETLPFQEGTPLAPIKDKHTPTEVATTNSSLCTLDREVFMAVGDAGTSEERPDRYLDDISEDKLIANAPPNETTEDKNAWRDCNKKRNDRRQRLREALHIENLNEALDQVANRVHTTPEQCLMSITMIAQ